MKKTLLSAPTLLADGKFLKLVFLFPPGFFDRHYPMFISFSDIKSIVTDNFLKRSDRNKRSTFLGF